VSEKLGAHVLFAGRTTLDALYWLDELPPEDTKVFARAFRIAPGGPACNAAITHALMGGSATLVSAVGRGPSAEAVREALCRWGVRLIDLAVGSAYETPLTTVLVNGSTSSRTIVNPPVAMVELASVDEVWKCEWGPIPQVALSDGFYLAETLPLLQWLRANGCALCFDGGSWKPGTEEVAPLLDTAICSERFALPGRRAEAETTLAWFAGLGVPHVAVTRGAHSIVALDRGRRFEVPVRRIEAVDTLGAGDVLHGAFCFHFATSGDFETALRSASEAATLACEKLGITHWRES